MNYNQYLRLMNFVGGFYDFHPEFFDELSDGQKRALSVVFLYDYDDTHDDNKDFPPSIRDYYNNLMISNSKDIAVALSAVATLYDVSGMGKFDLKNISSSSLLS